MVNYIFTINTRIMSILGMVIKNKEEEEEGKKITTNLTSTKTTN